ncbi:MAG: type II toxin-antitoxin system RelE/ParE family toxin [Candidatus Saccharimonadales bacterium]
MYQIKYRKSVEKELRKIPSKQLQLIVKKIQLLADNPFPPQSTSIKGTNFFRIRHGSYRVVYHVDDQEVIISIIRVAHRKDVYRGI